MSKITVTTIAGLTSGSDANKVKIESGDTLESSTIGTASGAMSIKPAGTEIVNVGTTGDLLVKGTTNQRAALILRAGSNTANSQIRLGDQAADDVGRIMYNHSDDTLIFQTAGAERFRVSASGIHIGGTGAANALDDYEEGTFTPVSGSGSLTGNSGVYTKIGNVVRVGMKFTMPSSSSGSSATISGLPFTCYNDNAARAGIVVSWNSNSQGNAGLDFLIGENTTAGTFYIDGASRTYANLSSDTIYLGGTYPAA